MNLIECGLQLFKAANEIQTKTIRATEIIKRATEEAEGMPEPFKSNFGWLVTKLVDECENVSGQEGKWRCRAGYYDCSVCGSHVVTKWKYCPCCGARMEVSDANSN